MHPFIISCNDASVSRSSAGDAIRLSYLKSGKRKPNVKVGLPTLVQSVYHLPDRILDLLEIACFVFAADRYCSRGPRDAVEFHSWPRDFRFFIKVRDAKFWSQSIVSEKLAELLTFLTGDNSYEFTFQGGHNTPQVDLFDEEKFHVDLSVPTEIALFSGGLDSLAGTIHLLESGVQKLCLASHRSGQPDTIKTQEGLFEALKCHYPGRIEYYKFHTSLTGQQSREETQRTRSFLYCSIAFALSSAHQKDRFYIFENGVTSMNLPRREDSKNARASRTTHPKTIMLMKEFLSTIEERAIIIETPFFWKTKTDVLLDLKSSSKEQLLPSSVSCSRTRQPFSNGTHCGVCYQCIDRRFAAFAAELDGWDHKSLYNTNFVTESISDGEAKTSLLGYIAQAKEFAELNGNALFDKYLTELVDIVDYVDGSNDDERILKVLELCKRHGEQVWDGLKKLRMKYDDLTKPVIRGSLLDILNSGEHLKDPLQRIIADISATLLQNIPIIYRKEPPRNENRLNDAIEALLQRDKERFVREYPSIPFALCKTIPDHFDEGGGLLIEAKYLREKSSVVELTNQLGADVFKYPEQNPILFIIYDPNRKIYDDVKFMSDIQNRDSRCTVLIIR